MKHSKYDYFSLAGTLNKATSGSIVNRLAWLIFYPYISELLLKKS